MNQLLKETRPVTLAETREFFQRLCASARPKSNETMAKPRYSEYSEDEYTVCTIDFGSELAPAGREEHMGIGLFFFDGNRFAFGFTIERE